MKLLANWSRAAPFRRGPRFAAASFAGGARVHDRNVHLLVDAARRLHERQAHLKMTEVEVGLNIVRQNVNTMFGPRQQIKLKSTNTN